MLIVPVFKGPAILFAQSPHPPSAVSWRSRQSLGVEGGAGWTIADVIWWLFRRTAVKTSRLKKIHLKKKERFGWVGGSGSKYILQLKCLQNISTIYRIKRKLYSYTGSWLRCPFILDVAGKKVEDKPIIIADVSSYQSLLDMSQQTKVVLNCVGPVSRGGVEMWEGWNWLDIVKTCFPGFQLVKWNGLQVVH